MADTGIHFYYKNVMADVLGYEHGITQDQLQELGKITSTAVRRVNGQREAGKTPYRDLPYQSEYVAKAKSLADEIAGEAEIFVVLGIGGSALGNIALQTALNPYMYNMDSAQRKGPQFFVFDNVDPEQFGSFLDWIGDRLDRTVFNVISKSGRTAETASQFLTIRRLLQDRLGETWKRHMVATTDARQGTLRTITDAEGYRCLEVPDGVGGRFSVLSHVGLLSAAVCGIDIDSLLAGASAMDDRLKTEDFFKNPAAVCAAIQYYYYQNGKPISVMMPYSYALKDFADWYRQLWAESLGKQYDLEGKEVFVGPTPVKALGTTDQHSQVQLYREGPNDKIFTLLEVANFRNEVTIGPAPESAPELEYLADAKMSDLFLSEKKATEYALIKSKRPCLDIVFDSITPESVGQFIMFYEVVTSITGELFGINTYDQPAVELGKEATFALMKRPGFEDLAGEIESVSRIDEKYRL